MSVFAVVKKEGVLVAREGRIFPVLDSTTQQVQTYERRGEEKGQPRELYAWRPRFSSWNALQTPRTLSFRLWTDGRFNDAEIW